MYYVKYIAWSVPKNPAASKSKGKYLVGIKLYFYPETAKMHPELDQAQLERFYTLEISGSFNFKTIHYSAKIGNKNRFSEKGLHIPKASYIEEIDLDHTRTIFRWFFKESLNHYKSLEAKCPFNMLIRGLCIGEIKDPSG